MKYDKIPQWNILITQYSGGFEQCLTVISLKTNILAIYNKIYNLIKFQIP